PVWCFQGQGVHAKSESKRDAPKVYKPRALSLLDDGLFRPTVAKARLVYKTMGRRGNFAEIHKWGGLA
ncbi:hypothetical protein, partial [Burkholderia ubonensis]|uniref:hypothetical protein n=1 Tax=Burkholderia ubonensis TaxID=101571 RepID=UPI001E587E6E